MSYRFIFSHTKLCTFTHSLIHSNIYNMCSVYMYIHLCMEHWLCFRMQIKGRNCAHKSSHRRSSASTVLPSHFINICIVLKSVHMQWTYGCCYGITASEYAFHFFFFRPPLESSFSDKITHCQHNCKKKKQKTTKKINKHFQQLNH